MPSFDIVSEIERMEIENAVNQAVKELATRFDFKGSSAKIELTKPELITLSAEDANKLKGVREIMVGKLAKRGVDLRNVEQKDPAVSSIGNTRQEFVITQGLREPRPRRSPQRSRPRSSRCRPHSKIVRSASRETSGTNFRRSSPSYAPRISESL